MEPKVIEGLKERKETLGPLEPMVYQEEMGGMEEEENLEQMYIANKLINNFFFHFHCIFFILHLSLGCPWSAWHERNERFERTKG